MSGASEKAITDCMGYHKNKYIVFSFCSLIASLAIWRDSLFFIVELSSIMQWDYELEKNSSTQRQVSAAGGGFGGKKPKNEPAIGAESPRAAGEAPARPLQTMLGALTERKTRNLKKVPLPLWQDFNHN